MTWLLVGRTCQRITVFGGQPQAVHTGASVGQIGRCNPANTISAIGCLVLDFAIKHRVLKTAQSCSGLPTRGNQPGQ
jgi:hypothetical protein